MSDVNADLGQEYRRSCWTQAQALPGGSFPSMPRRLAKASDHELAAENQAYFVHWGKGKNVCVFNVLVTGDLEIAVAAVPILTTRTTFCSTFHFLMMFLFGERVNPFTIEIRTPSN
jgi:hypothetical protein